jgi:hypothetical protein
MIADNDLAINLGGACFGGTAKLGQDLQHAIQMGQTRTEPIHELVQEKIAFGQRISVFVDFFCQR